MRLFIGTNKTRHMSSFFRNKNDENGQNVSGIFPWFLPPPLVLFFFPKMPPPPDE
jgi:hypothetical protein